MWKSILILTGSVLAFNAAHAQPQLPTELRGAFMNAMNAPDGRYEGRLTGTTAAALQRRFATSAPFFIRVSTIHQFKQPGCKRLQSNIFAPESSIKRTDGTSAPFDFDFQLNLCPNGQPPSEETYIQPPGSPQMTIEEYQKRNPVKK